MICFYGRHLFSQCTSLLLKQLKPYPLRAYVSIRQHYGYGSNTKVQIAMSLCLFQFAHNNERYEPLIVVAYILPFTGD